MSIYIADRTKSRESDTAVHDTASSIHLLPCRIQSDSVAAVSQYFVPTIITNSQSDNSRTTLKASFRGRPLEGERVELPPGYIGLVLSEEVNSSKSKEDSSSKSKEDSKVREENSSKSREERTLTVENKFKSLTQWNLDQAPGLSDKFTQALKWLEISQAIHCSLTDNNNSSQTSSISPSL